MNTRFLRNMMLFYCFLPWFCAPVFWLLAGGLEGLRAGLSLYALFSAALNAFALTVAYREGQDRGRADKAMEVLGS